MIEFNNIRVSFSSSANEEIVVSLTKEAQFQSEKSAEI